MFVGLNLNFRSGSNEIDDNFMFLLLFVHQNAAKVMTFLSIIDNLPYVRRESSIKITENHMRKINTETIAINSTANLFPDPVQVM